MFLPGALEEALPGVWGELVRCGWELAGWGWELAGRDRDEGGRSKEEGGCGW